MKRVIKAFRLVLLGLIVAHLSVQCGARKVEKVKEVKESIADTKTAIDSTYNMATIKQSEATTYNLSDDFDFDIEPINGVPAQFIINDNGRILHGQTNAKLHISKRKKTEQKKEIIQDKTELSGKVNIVKKQKKKETTKHIAKKTDKKGGFFQGLGIAISVMALLSLIIWALLGFLKNRIK